MNPATKCCICDEKLSKVDQKTTAPVFQCQNCAMGACVDCILQSFEIALQDHEYFPAQVPCLCGTRRRSKLDFETYRHLLSPVEAELYDERLKTSEAPDPLFCAIPTCSTLILSDRSDIIDLKSFARCRKCNNNTCIKCRAAETAHETNQCPDNETNELLRSTLRHELKYCPGDNCDVIGVEPVGGCKLTRYEANRDCWLKEYWWLLKMS